MQEADSVTSEPGDYDAEMGRFISRDPAQDGLNWYIYCYNNPLIYMDPNGLKVLPPKEYNEEFGEWYDAFLYTEIYNIDPDTAYAMDFDEDYKRETQKLEEALSVSSDYIPYSRLDSEAEVYVKFSVSGYAVIGASLSVSITNNGIFFSVGVGFGLGATAQVTSGVNLIEDYNSVSVQTVVGPGSMSGSLDPQTGNWSLDYSRGVSVGPGKVSVEHITTVPIIKF